MGEFKTVMGSLSTMIVLVNGCLKVSSWQNVRAAVKYYCGFTYNVHEITLICNYDYDRGSSSAKQRRWLIKEDTEF